ncbi:MAG: hypothetical protein IKO65_08065 [Victivallales bacterium]|nr:hypothetical protein [Victivallales bacterium]
MKMTARFAYYAFAVFILLACIGFWEMGQSEDIPAMLLSLLIPRAWWRWMWGKTHVSGHDAKPSASDECPMSPPC